MGPRRALTFARVAAASVLATCTAAFVSVAGVSLAGGCSLVTSYDGFTGADATTSDERPIAEAGPAPVGEASVDAAAPCVAEIPSPPAVPDDGKGTFAMFAISSTLQFTDEPSTCTLGLDLAAGHDCKNPACTLAQPNECSQAQGHDDTGKNALALSAMVENTTFTNVLSDALNRFEIGLLLGVSSYDGEPSDSTVTVSMYNVVGGTEGAAIVDHNDINTPEIDQKAYVNNNVLVAHFPAAFALRLEIGRSVGLPDGGMGVLPTVMMIEVTDPVLVAPIALTNGGQAVTFTNAQLAGRIRVVDFLPVLGQLKGCNYPTLVICPFADLPASTANDGTKDKCDAISFALQFNAVPSTKSGGGIGLPPIDLCVDGGLDDDDAGDASEGTMPPPPIDAGPYVNPCQ